MDLSTTYMGLKLASPLVCSPSPLCKDIDNIRRMEDAGAAAVVLHSLFEEQIEHDAAELEHYLQYGADRFPESLTYFPQPHDYPLGPEEYLRHIARAKKAVKIPVLASLNGVSARGWIRYAHMAEEAGADGIELNVYYIPTNPQYTGDKVEEVYLTVLEAVKGSAKIPVSMKLSPYFSSMANVATRLDQAGANALVLFNRFYQPDIDVDELEVVPNLVLSDSDDSRLPLRWIAILHGKVKASLAATSGIHTARDVAKMIMAGADVTMMTSALLKNGIGHLTTVRKGLEKLMQAKGYDSVSQMKGILSQKSCAEPAAFERANYMKTLSSYGWTATLE